MFQNSIKSKDISIFREIVAFLKNSKHNFPKKIKKKKKNLKKKKEKRNP